VTFLLSVLRITVPYALAALGGLLSERAGVINIALEGTLLVGAFGAATAAHLSHSVAVGMLVGVAAGVALQLIHAVVSVRFRADQIVSAVAANLLAVGATRFLLKLLFDSTANSPRVEHTLGGLWFVAMAVALVAAVQFALHRLPFGLRLRACGEHPEAARTLGVPVARVRLVAVGLCGALAGLGGVYLAFEQHKFVDNMSAGRGYVALAALIFGKWRPLPAVAACLLFGLAEATQIRLQASGIGIPNQLIQIIPDVLTIAALSGAVGRALAPAALGARLADD
jgi:simple sugar transport system permease protein